MSTTLPDPDGASAATAEAANAYDANGVDRTLIRWMLRLTPTERLAYLQGVIDVVHATRRPDDGPR